MKNLLIFLLSVLTLTKVCKGFKYDTYYINQKVDHFSYSNSDHFKQRYLVNMDFYSEENGTIFFYTGNEGDIEMFANNTGFMWENAKKFNAALVFAEHRFYGVSCPYKSLDKWFLGYLTSEQALADYANLIMHLKKSHKAPVFAIGGSYGGMLAAWIRIKYPHLVDGALASSAPVLQFQGLTPCNTFVEIVSEDFFKEGIECVLSIKKSWHIIRSIYAKRGGLKFLAQTFHLCEDNDLYDVNDLVNWLEETWSFLAMLDYPYATSFLVPLPAYPIKEACKFLKNSSISEEQLVRNIYMAASVFQNYTGNVKCFNLTNSGGPSLGELEWDFQACTEMVQPMCQTGLTDMFELKKWDFKKYSDNCYKKFGVRPELHKAKLMYGGRNMKAASNIIFTNGLLDPWHGGGVLKNLSDTLIAIVIKGAAHHLDLRSSDPSDSPYLLQARQDILKYMSQWISR